MGAIIIQNISFVTLSKRWYISPTTGSDINLLKRDVVKWQKQRYIHARSHIYINIDTHTHTWTHTHTKPSPVCGVTPQCKMNNMKQRHHYPTQCICYRGSYNEVSVWWPVQSPIAQMHFEREKNNKESSINNMHADTHTHAHTLTIQLQLIRKKEKRELLKPQTMLYCFPKTLEKHQKIHRIEDKKNEYYCRWDSNCNKNAVC